MKTIEGKRAVLIVEDDRTTREGIAKYLRGAYDVTIAEDGVRALNILGKSNFDLVISDIRMPGVDGLEILKRTLEMAPPPPCVLITAYATVEMAVEAMKAGAYDFVSKPVNLDRLELIIQRALESHRLREENEQLRQRLDEKYGFGNIVGNSAKLHEVLEEVKQIAPARSTVLISGESGTGKELIAQAVHNLSKRKGPFVAVHCAALPATLLESELFGHERGAFTGAVEQRKGRFETADGGTIFLDEIGEIDLPVQVKLLRVLETRTFERVGGAETITTDARIVTATNRNLKAMVEKGEFREDLFYRLDVINITLPPLRERQEDIPLLLKYYVDFFATENGKKIDGVSDETVDLLCAYDWPGNIRELRNCVERMVVLSKDATLGVTNIPNFIREKVSPSLASTFTPSSSLNIEQNERRLITLALAETNGNRSAAAEKLGISRRTLHRKLNEYKIGDQQPD